MNGLLWLTDESIHAGKRFFARHCIVACVRGHLVSCLYLIYGLIYLLVQGTLEIQKLLERLALQIYLKLSPALLEF